jgi:hypothetical protein
MKRPTPARLLLSSLSLAALWPTAAHSFCGFYVARGDAQLFNQASQVVLVRDGDRTVMTMVNDFKGEPKEFAIVIPVPTVLKKGQIHVGDKTVVDHLDAFSAPRLVEYWEEDPCPPEGDIYGGLLGNEVGEMNGGFGFGRSGFGPGGGGVAIEAQFDVAEYQILILSASEAAGLEDWLRLNHYKIPDDAEPLLRPYIESGMKFFVAKVDPKKVQFVNGMVTLSPLRFHYDADDFTLRGIGRLRFRFGPPCRKSNADRFSECFVKVADVRPEATRSGFADEHDGRVRLRFLIGEATPARDAKAESLKIIGRDKCDACLQRAISELWTSGKHHQRRA